MDVPGLTTTMDGGAAATHPPVAFPRLAPARSPPPTRARLALAGPAGLALAPGAGGRMRAGRGLGRRRSLERHRAGLSGGAQRAERRASHRGGPGGVETDHD